MTTTSNVAKDGNPTGTIAVSYLRVSTTRQMQTGADVDAEGNSIATQRQANLAKAVKLRATIQEEFVEPGASAQTIEKRPVFRQMLDYLAEHPEVSVVIIYMRSRAFRNLGDAVLTKRKLEAMGVKLVSAKEDFGDGIMADAMEAVTDIINEVQVRMSGEDIKAKMRHKAERGGTNGRARIGYKNVRIEHEGRQINSIAVDEDRAPLIRQAFELYATGDYSLMQLHDEMAELGLTTRPTRARPSAPLSKSQIQRMLADPYYIGLVHYKDEVFEGRHDTFIPTDLFDRVQDVLAHRAKPGSRDRTHFHYLKGLLWCARCKQAGRTSRLIYTEAKGKGGTYAYYLCRGRQNGDCDLPYLPVADVEWYVAQHYTTMGLPSDFVTIIREAISVTMQEAKSNIQAMHTAYKKKLARLAAKEERLLDLAENGTLPTAKIQERLMAVAIERASAKEGLTQSADKLAVGAEILTTYLGLLETPYDLYQGSTEAARRDLNTLSFERLFLDDHGVQGDQKTDTAQEFHDAATTYQTVGTPSPETVTGRLMDSPATTDQTIGGTNPTDENENGQAWRLSDLFDCVGSSKNRMVRGAGLEPARAIRPRDFKSLVSTNSTTCAYF